MWREGEVKEAGSENKTDKWNRKTGQILLCGQTSSNHDGTGVLSRDRSQMVAAAKVLNIKVFPFW